MSNFVKLPPQQLPFNRKNKKWRKLHCDWADSKIKMLVKVLIIRRLILI